MAEEQSREEKQPVAVEKGEVTGGQMKEIEAGDFVTIKEVATKLRFTSAWISLLCAQGRIRAIKPVGRGWRIPRSEWRRITTEGLPPLPREPKKTVTTLEMSEKQETRIRGKEKEAKKKESWFPLDFSGLFGGKDE